MYSTVTIVCISLIYFVLFLAILIFMYFIFNVVKHYKITKNLKINITDKDFPFKKYITDSDVFLNRKYAPKYRGSVRLSNSKIFTDEQIESKRKQAYTKLP